MADRSNNDGAAAEEQNFRFGGGGGPANPAAAVAVDSGGGDDAPPDPPVPEPQPPLQPPPIEYGIYRGGALDPAAVAVVAAEPESPMAQPPHWLPVAPVARPSHYGTTSSSNQAALRQQALLSPAHGYPMPPPQQLPPGHVPPLAAAPRPPAPPLPPQAPQRLSHPNLLLSVSIPERETDDAAALEALLDSPAPVSGWTEVEVAPDAGSVAPSARSLHAAALLNGTLYCFGGYDGAQRVNTFHAFSFAERRWYPVLPSAHSGGPPSPRDRHVAVAFGNSIYIHGGFDGTARVADFWAFDLSTLMWREVLPLQGRPPSARHSHAAVVAGHCLYVFGGYDGAYKCDLHEFDFHQARWSLVPAAGRRPRARYRATCVVHRQSMILYGGHDGTRHLSDTHVFDLDTHTWSGLVVEGVPPIPRDSHVSVVHGHSMYVFGGSSGSAMNDLFELQLPAAPGTAARWRPVPTPAAGFQPRHRFCHVAVVYNDSMYCFGGYDGADRLNDFIRFDFAVYDLSFEVPPSTILGDLRSMINDSTLSDVTLLVEDKAVHAHKLILTRCSYFQALFLGNMRESRQDTVRLEQVRHPIFLQVLEYLYTDQVRVSLGDAMELFEAADLFCIPRLKTMCEKRMLQSITIENCAAVFHAADMHSATALRQKAKKYLLSHFEEASKTAAFEEMGRRNIDLIFELLQCR